MVLVTTPADAKVALAEGSSIWALHASDVDDEVDNLIKQGRVSDAIGLVEATGESSLSPVSRILTDNVVYTEIWI